MGVNDELLQQERTEQANSDYHHLKWIEDFVEKEIAIIEADVRYHYKPALVQVNAPLALIQVEMGSRMATLRQIQELLKS